MQEETETCHDGVGLIAEGVLGNQHLTLVNIFTTGLS